MARTSVGLRFNRAASQRGLYLLGWAFAAAVAVFLVFPQLDMSTSAMFGHATGFPLRRSIFWEDVRQVFIIITNGAAVMLFGCWLVLHLRAAVAHRGAFYRIAGFSAFAYLVIPGVLVNAIIKPLWARARPFDVADFGGALGFTSPFQLSGECQGSCSFVSGETSALFTCATLAVLFLVPTMAEKWRVPSLWVIWALAGFGSLLRIAVGAHFLSDVVFSAVLSSATVLALALRFFATASRSAPINPAHLIDGYLRPTVQPERKFNVISCFRNTTIRNLRLSTLLIVAPAPQVQAAIPAGPSRGDMAGFVTIIDDVESLSATGDFTAAEKRITDFESAWDSAKGTLRIKNKAYWGNVDDAAHAACRHCGRVTPKRIRSPQRLQICKPHWPNHPYRPPMHPKLLQPLQALRPQMKTAGPCHVR